MRRLLAALLVFVGTRLAFGTRNFAIANAVFVLVWLALAAAIVKLRKREGVVEAETRAAA